MRSSAEWHQHCHEENRAQGKLVVYCFGYDRKAVRDDIRRKNDTDIQRIITQRVKAGECRCEETNPSGGCCLGSVAKVIKEARALKDQGLL